MKRFADLLAEIVLVDGCWEWPGRFDRNGYGKVGGRWAHRAVYQLFNAPIPKGKHLDHLCRNTRCVRPSHLEVVTPVENFMRGVHRSAITARTHRCQRGHEMPGRECRICERGRRRGWFARLSMDPTRLAHRRAINRAANQRLRDRRRTA